MSGCTAGWPSSGGWCVGGGRKGYRLSVKKLSLDVLRRRLVKKLRGVERPTAGLRGRAGMMWCLVVIVLALLWGWSGSVGPGDCWLVGVGSSPVVAAALSWLVMAVGVIFDIWIDICDVVIFGSDRPVHMGGKRRE